MSLFSSIRKIGSTLLKSPLAKPALAMVPGVGTALALGATAYQAYSSIKSPMAGAVMPGVGSSLSLPQLGSYSLMGSLSPGVIAGGGRALVAGGRAAARGAVNLCRKYPQWCAGIGGTVAIEAMMNSGQIPIPKRRRGRGITAGELKSFKRVARFTSRYCAPVHRAMKSSAVRGGKSCR
jgi:hypothetical protein